MKINSFKYLACFVSLSIVFLALPGQADNGTLLVKCVDASGTPVQNAKVVALNVGTEKSKDKKSDAQGSAEFTKLDDGAYRVFGRKDGFAPALHEFTVLKGSTESVTLTFAAGEDKKLYFEDPAEMQRANSMLQLGLDAFKQNKLPEAEKLLAQSIEINPSLAEAVYYYGAVLLPQGKFDQSEEMFVRAEKLADILKTTVSPNPSGTNPYELVSQGAKAQLKQLPLYKAEQAVRQKNYDLAAKEYAEAIKNDPQNSEHHYNRAVVLSNAGKHDEALASIDKAIQLKPEQAAYADVKARISARKENAMLEKAQSIMNEGNKLLQNGNAAEALKKFEESRSMVAEDKQGPLWSQIGKAYANLNQRDEAIAAFKKSIQLASEKNAADFRKAFAQFYIDAKEYDEAIGVLAESSASSNTEQALLELAKTWKNKEPNFAIAALEKVIGINPQNDDAYFDLGQLYYIEGKSKDSRTKELLTKYLEIGKDQEKIQGAKDMLVIVNKRSK
ncbi:MAG: tetratricopeptide repeat protein [Acidobacteria bacterium]|nr:tetratricopeptide repeat protein [Acidobacteriota bacterium]